MVLRHARTQVAFAEVESQRVEGQPVLHLADGEIDPRLDERIYPLPGQPGVDLEPAWHLATPAADGPTKS